MLFRSQSLAIKYFKIESIPRYILIDANGDIISNDTKIDELDKLISRFLNVE